MTMTTNDDFAAIFETLKLDPDVPPRESLRAKTTAPTVAFSGLPSVDLGTATHPEFELGATIGEGGMGVVRLARQLALHREVAVKTLREDRRTSTSRDGLLHEALITGALEHPNVVPVYTLGQTADGIPVIVMKRIEGVPWDQCIDDPSHAPQDPGDELGWHLEIFSQLCQAVHFAHSRGIIHRDIKPENVMIGAYGEVYLVDWGVAVTNDHEKPYLVHVDAADGICGTPAYMAPEMTTGRGEDLGVHTDVYLLGATLFHAVTGEPPHHGSSLFEIMHHAYVSQPLTPDDVPDELVAILQRAMAKDPAQRFSSVDELRRAVLEFERHRLSVTLAEEVAERLGELEDVVRREDPADDALVRELVGECRFGSEQALKTWPENRLAQVVADRSTCELVRWELFRENLDAATSALAQVSEPPAELRAALEEARERLQAQAEDVQELRRMQSDLDLSAAARTRAIVGAAGMVCWTVVPLVAGYWVRQGWSVVTPDAYLSHGWFVASFLALLLWVVRKPLIQNHANRRLLRIAAAFMVWVPCYRYIVMQSGVEVVPALCMEITTYGLVVGAIAIMSERWATYPIVVYLAGGLLASRFPYYVYEFTALSNLLAIGWLTIVWFRQARAEVSGDEPQNA